MRTFNETGFHSDEVRGLATYGGDAKTWWLTWSDTTFECKPLQHFFHSFRRFHRDHLRKLENAPDSDKNRQILEEYEKELKKDIFSLVSHFDTVLHDPEADWTGPESYSTSLDTQPQNALLTTDAERPGANRKSESTPPIETTQKQERKRKREEPQACDQTRAKRIKENKTIPRAPRRRRPLPPPSDRVLRPRPPKK